MDVAPAGYSPAQALRAGTREDVRMALQAVRRDTLALASAWRDALGLSLAVPREPGLNPPLWEWGHVAWFQQWWLDRNRQRGRGAACDPDHPRPPSDLRDADAWYDSSRVSHAARWDLPLPDFEATLAWLDDTQARSLALLDGLPADAGDDALYFFRLAALHEAMHAEASRYMARSLGIAVPGPDRVPPPLDEGVLCVPACEWTLGWRGPGFAFDNELAAHRVALPAFEIDAAPVTWDRFNAFVEAGGYAQASWWTAEGWAWRQAARPARPAFLEGDQAACHLSCHEAQAWCRWAGRRLPTEAQWECAAFTAPGFAWGAVWEWTASDFLPFAGFAPHPYRDYSQPWFGARRVLRGASADTPAALAHPRFRNFFAPDRTDIRAGFRTCAANAPA